MKNFLSKKITSLFLLLIFIGCSGNRDVMFFYLIDRSGTFYNQGATDQSIALADKIFKILSEDMSANWVAGGINQYHVVNSIDEKGYGTDNCNIVISSETNIFADKKEKNNLDVCFKSIKKLGKSKMTDIDGAIYNVSSTFEENTNLSKKALIIFSDLHNESPKRQSEFISKLNGVEVFIVFIPSIKQQNDPSLARDDKQKMIKMLNDNGVNKNNISITNYNSVVVNPNIVLEHFMK